MAASDSSQQEGAKPSHSLVPSRFSNAFPCSEVLAPSATAGRGAAGAATAAEVALMAMVPGIGGGMKGLGGLLKK